MGFKLLLRGGGGLRRGVGSDLNTVILVGGCGENERGEFSLLKRLGHRQCVAFFLYRGDLQNDRVFRDERGADGNF